MGQFPNPDTQFKKGNPGSPGRPKGAVSPKEALRGFCMRELPEEVAEIIKQFSGLMPKSYAEALAAKLIGHALQDPDKALDAIKYAIDQLDGRAKQTVDTNHGVQGNVTDEDRQILERLNVPGATGDSAE